MNKTAIKNFAIWARNKLIADIQYRAGLMGITADGIKDPLPQSTGTMEFYDIGTSEPYAISGDAIPQRKKLVEVIRKKENDSNYATAYKYILEEVAYTWFNRLIAIRFMEVNDYLPSHIRVLSSESGKIEPDLVTTPFDAELAFTSAEEETVLRLKTENKLDELFRLLFIKQCNALNEILPALFEKTSDYTELLLNLSVVDREGVVYHLTHDIPEQDFDITHLDEDGNPTGQVEIIGWLYQYYNTEPKNAAFAKNGKITKEEIPAVTQLFTPDWIVRYMVENSLGRIFIDKRKEQGVYADGRGLDEMSWDEVEAKRISNEEEIAGQMGWKYYLPEAAQTREVRQQLDEVQKQNEYKDVRDIKVIDPCMGSGHILVYAFDVLMKMYENDGYSQRDAAQCILEHNLFGLDIDERAAQLAYFAVMMKARQYDRRIFSRGIQPHVYAIAESNDIDTYTRDYFANNDPKLRAALDSIMNDLRDAKEYGSILTMAPVDFAALYSRMDEVQNDISLYRESALNTILPLIRVAEVLAQQYDVVVTNPPYMGSSNMDARLSDFVKKRYTAQQSNFSKIPGSPVAYWASPNLIHSFESMNLAERGFSYQGIITGDVNHFLRLWYEVNIDDITFGEVDSIVLQNSETYYPYIKGGAYNKWYGNLEYVLKWENNGAGLVRSRTENRNYFFKAGITWSLITTSSLSFRWFDKGFLCDVSGSSYFPNDENETLYILSFLNSSVSVAVLSIINPTINLNIKDIMLMPLITNNIQTVSKLTEQCISFSKADWDSYETSWDFQQHPLAPLACERQEQENSQFYSSRMEKFGHISWHYEKWAKECEDRFVQMKANEEELNLIFINIYGLQDELTPDVADKDVTVHRIFDTKDDVPESMQGSNYYRTKRDEIVSLLSYAVGCMFGRYSLDVDGLAYAGGDWDDGKYKTFLPDRDGILPITDEEYLEDDIVSRLCGWLKAVYGADTLEENLDFIAGALGGKGNSSREIIRSYFLKDFFKDHCKTYQKRPIYWLFDSGKQNGFKALIYLHRYTPDTIGNLRVDYLHKMQRVYESEINRMQDMIDHSTNAREVAASTKRKEKLQKQLKECRDYDEMIAHLALSRIELDLDDGVKVNYEKIQTASDGKKYAVLAKI